MKILKWIMKALVALVATITLIVVFNEELEHTYNKLTWTPPTEINGITIGMTRSDVVFKLGQPAFCLLRELCLWVNDIDGDGLHALWFADDLAYKDKSHQVWFKDDLAYKQFLDEPRWLPSIPFKNTTDMKSLLGDEDIFAESKDFSTRGYTYVEWGTSFVFENDTLTSYIIGEVTWRNVLDSGKYVVKGTVVCPSAECPFDDEGAVKEDFKGRDYTYFIE